MKRDEPLLTDPSSAGDSYLTQLAQYLGSILVGLLIPTLLKRKADQYAQIPTHQVLPHLCRRTFTDNLHFRKQYTWKDLTVRMGTIRAKRTLAVMWKGLSITPPLLKCQCSMSLPTFV